jgi:hypothetical protein
MREWSEELLAGDAVTLGRRRCALLGGVAPAAAGADRAAGSGGAVTAGGGRVDEGVVSAASNRRVVKGEGTAQRRDLKRTPATQPITAPLASVTQG